jgi:hypothetical protein
MFLEVVLLTASSPGHYSVFDHFGVIIYSDKVDWRGRSKKIVTVSCIVAVNSES